MNILSKVVVMDPGRGPLCRQNMLFDRRNISPDARHALAGCYLYEQCQKREISLLTPDLYFALAKRPRKAILWRNNTMSADTSNKLVKSGVHPAMLMGFEQPLYACRFYWNLERQSRDYDHTFMPVGAKEFASKKTRFHPMTPAVRSLTEEKRIKDVRFKDKKFLVLINSNARIRRLKRLYVGLMHWLKPLPTFINREGYLDRLEAIRYFSNDAGFDLFGIGWSNPVSYTRGKYDEGIKKSYRGQTPDKIETLKNYKFSLCIENCFFAGLITEKIFDSFIAGCVPVYFGAPNITDCVPENCFIDFRRFKNFQDLDRFLKQIDEKTYNAYLENIDAYMKTPQYRMFTQEKLVEDLIPLFESYFG